MAEKFRSQLKTQSDNTFLDNSTGQIVPVNHRTWNDDSTDSAANVVDDNVFSGNNTFEQQILSTVASGNYALYAADGDVYLSNGNMDVGGQTNLNTTFIRRLKNCFATNPIIASSVLDLLAVDGNYIYIQGDATIDTFNGNVGEIFYATFTGTCIFDASMSGIVPPVNFQVFPNDTLIFIFTGATEIRILGVRRGGDWINSVFNGVNYFTIYNPADALLIAANNALDIGATYRVVSATELPKQSGFFWDVYLTAKQTNLYEDTCWIKCPTFNGTAQKAFFLGDFNTESILITDRLDSTVEFDLDTALINDGAGARYLKDGAQTFVNDSFATGFAGYLHANFGGKTQLKNILDVAEGNNNFGSIYTISGQKYWVTNHGSTNDGVFGANFAFTGPPAVSTINLAMTAASITTQLFSYNCCYQVVNGVCTVHFNAIADGRFNAGTSGREFLLWLPIPFSGQGAAVNQYGYGSLRNNTDSNHPDMGIRVSKQSSQYMVISAKWSSAVSSVKTCELSGCFVYPVLTHP